MQPMRQSFLTVEPPYPSRCRPNPLSCREVLCVLAAAYFYILDDAETPICDIQWHQQRAATAAAAARPVDRTALSPSRNCWSSEQRPSCGSECRTTLCRQLSTTCSALYTNCAIRRRPVLKLVILQSSLQQFCSRQQKYISIAFA